MKNSPFWRIPPTTLFLERDEVHVWRASLNQEQSCINSLRAILSGDEQLRAGRYYFPEDQSRFIVARGLLRKLLGLYLGVHPAQLPFCYNQFGKPSLTGSLSDTGIEFNLSHAQEIVLYAVTRKRLVGIDIEHIRTDADIEQIAQQFFAHGEAVSLMQLPEPLRLEACFNCWTRKEAFVKAHGEGLSLSLDQFEVSVTPGEPAKLLRTDFDSQEISRWSLRNLIPDPGYVAALAVEGQDYKLTGWQWDNELSACSALA